jgi:hypothetical protein
MFVTRIECLKCNNSYLKKKIIEKLIINFLYEESER